MPEIKEIAAAATFPVRHPVLRPGKAIDTCRFDGDELVTTKHFGLYVAHTLVAVISIFESKSKFFAEDRQFQIRGMAVLEAYRKQRLGEQLVAHVEKYVGGQQGELIWFNARETAVGFYKKLGYAIIGDPFNIEDIGSHYTMFKNLTSHRL